MLVGRFEAATAGRALSDADTVVTVTADRSNFPLSALLQGRGASSGVHRVEFEVLGGPDSPHFALGVVEKPVGDACKFDSPYVWCIGGFAGARGLWTCGVESANPLTTPPSVGDVYALLLDMDAGVCDVAVNGGVKCRAWTGLHGLTLWPAVFMDRVGQRMKIRSCVSGEPAAGAAADPWGAAPAAKPAAPAADPWGAAPPAAAPAADPWGAAPAAKPAAPAADPWGAAPAAKPAAPAADPWGAAPAAKPAAPAADPWGAAPAAATKAAPVPAVTAATHVSAGEPDPFGELVKPAVVVPATAPAPQPQPQYSATPSARGPPVRTRVRGAGAVVDCRACSLPASRPVASRVPRPVPMGRRQVSSRVPRPVPMGRRQVVSRVPRPVPMGRPVASRVLRPVPMGRPVASRVPRPVPMGRPVASRVPRPVPMGRPVSSRVLRPGADRRCAGVSVGVCPPGPQLVRAQPAYGASATGPYGQPTARPPMPPAAATSVSVCVCVCVGGGGGVLERITGWLRRTRLTCSEVRLSAGIWMMVTNNVKLRDNVAVVV